MENSNVNTIAFYKMERKRWSLKPFQRIIYYTRSTLVSNRLERKYKCRVCIQTGMARKMQQPATKPTARWIRYSGSCGLFPVTYPAD